MGRDFLGYIAAASKKTLLLVHEAECYLGDSNSNRTPVFPILLSLHLPPPPPPPSLSLLLTHLQSVLQHLPWAHRYTQAIHRIVKTLYHVRRDFENIGPHVVHEVREGILAPKAIHPESHVLHCPASRLSVYQVSVGEYLMNKFRIGNLREKEREKAVMLCMICEVTKDGGRRRELGRRGGGQRKPERRGCSRKVGGWEEAEWQEEGGRGRGRENGEGRVKIGKQKQ